MENADDGFILPQVPSIIILVLGYELHKSGETIKYQAQKLDTHKKNIKIYKWY